MNPVGRSAAGSVSDVRRNAGLERAPTSVRSGPVGPAPAADRMTRGTPLGLVDLRASGRVARQRFAAEASQGAHVSDHLPDFTRAHRVARHARPRDASVDDAKQHLVGGRATQHRTREVGPPAARTVLAVTVSALGLEERAPAVDLLRGDLRARCRIDAHDHLNGQEPGCGRHCDLQSIDGCRSSVTDWCRTITTSHCIAHARHPVTNGGPEDAFGTGLNQGTGGNPARHRLAGHGPGCVTSFPPDE